MIQDYLKAGYPALCVLTQEPHRAEHLLVSEGWHYFHWDCLTGIREAGSNKIVEETVDIFWQFRVRHTGYSIWDPFGYFPVMMGGFNL